MTIREIGYGLKVTLAGCLVNDCVSVGTPLLAMWSFAGTAVIAGIMIKKC